MAAPDGCRRSDLDGTAELLLGTAYGEAPAEFDLVAVLDVPLAAIDRSHLGSDDGTRFSPLSERVQALDALGSHLLCTEACFYEQHTYASDPDPIDSRVVLRHDRGGNVESSTTGRCPAACRRSAIARTSDVDRLVAPDQSATSKTQPSCLAHAGRARRSRPKPCLVYGRQR